MKIPAPKQIQVGGKVYDITLCDDLLERENLDGVAIHRSYRIEIQKTANRDHVTEVFWHEVLHVINSVFNSNEITEAEIGRISNGLHQVLKGMGIEIEWE